MPRVLLFTVACLLFYGWGGGVNAQEHLIYPGMNETAKQAETQDTPPQSGEPAEAADDEPVYTQQEINAHLCSEARKVGAEMEATYKKVEAKYSYDTVFIKYLKQAQEAWMVYRDAQLKAIYPPEYTQHYGTMAVSCQCNEMAAMMKERIKVLKQWLDAPKADGGCVGTRTGGNKSAGTKVDVEKSK